MINRQNLQKFDKCLAQVTRICRSIYKIAKNFHMILDINIFNTMNLLNDQNDVIKDKKAKV